MTKRMLVDATHAEETRVAVVDGTRLVDFDYESKVRKQLKGSIFLAKVTRVEPSLQAAFVNFGGNRHGFLPFSEIHPDYFRIPIADREALLAEQNAEMAARLAEEEAEDEAEAEIHASSGGASAAREAGHDDDLDEDEEDDIEEVGGENAVRPLAGEDDTDAETAESASGKTGAATEKFAQDDAEHDTEDHDPNGNVREPGEDEDEGENEGEEDENAAEAGESRDGGRRGRGRGRRNRGRNNGRRGNKGAESRRVEVVGGDGIEGDQPVRPSLRRNYKIQEVIKRGQIMLIQVSKEERGNKGAAVTTYLSLPGRYCVLMPNSPRAGGVSRKIANFTDRRRMRELLSELSVPEGMSVIMRTAGVARTKPEIKRDLDYLTRLWNNIRDLTLSSTAPALVHEEGNLLRRSIRDIYSKDIEEIVIAGEEGYKLGRDFMKMLIPSHVRRVREYGKDELPLFHRYQVENQINEIGNPTVTLPSGGYLVINPTEALVSVDVNSGRATKGRHIEETALKTNLEAAEEVARQLRLRDLGGLVVIDFIDMEDRRNNRKVEQKLKQALSSDRARIQIGRISSFGLLELSRQRLNPSLTEAQYIRCPHCNGIGHVRSIDATAISALRALEEEGFRKHSGTVTLSVSSEVALYILNNKRTILAGIEERYGLTVEVQVRAELPASGYKIEHVAASVDIDDEGAEGGEEGQSRGNHRGERHERGERGERNDRGDRHERGERQEQRHDRGRRGEGQEQRERPEGPDEERGGEERGEGRKGRRRGRRGGRRRNGDREDRGESRIDGAEDTDLPSDIGNDNVRSPADDNDAAQPAPAAAPAEAVTGDGEEAKPAGRQRRSRKTGKTESPAAEAAAETAPKTVSETATETAGEIAADAVNAEKPEEAAPKKGRGRKTVAATAEKAPEKVAEKAAKKVAEAEPPAPRDYERVNEAPENKKRGWWNKIVQ